MNVAGATMTISRGDGSKINVSAGESALDWDKAFVSFDSSNVYTESGRDIFTAPRSRAAAADAGPHTSLGATPSASGTGTGTGTGTASRRQNEDDVLDPSKLRELALNEAGNAVPVARYDITTDPPGHKEKYYDGTKQYPYCTAPPNSPSCPPIETS